MNRYISELNRVSDLYEIEEIPEEGKKAEEEEDLGQTAMYKGQAG